VDIGSVRANRRTWEAIAASFDATRTRPWAPVASFLQALPPGARVLDAGCGNGRHLAEAASGGLRAVGLDFSVGLLRRARGRVHEASFVAGLVERLPFRPRSFDAVVAAASLHHVRGRGERVEALRGLRAATKAGGRILATAWMLDQPRFRERPLRAPAGAVEPGDALVAWTQHRLDESRYVHLYQEGELAQELRDAGWDVEREWTKALGGSEPDNLLALARA
jgi:tRNA (uracil-5-)-methyltransferase TRM9